MTTGLQLPQACRLAPIAFAQVHTTLPFVDMLSKVRFEVSLREQQERELAGRASPHRLAGTFWCFLFSFECREGWRVLHADGMKGSDIDCLCDRAEAKSARFLSF